MRGPQKTEIIAAIVDLSSVYGFIEEDSKIFSIARELNIST